MESLHKEFVPYELALKMKQLGFDEPCVASYRKYVDEATLDIGFSKNKLISKFKNLSEFCSAPLYQQAFRWFREKYNLKGHVEPVEYLDGTPDTYHWSIFDNCNSGNDQLTHEEAELACLVKLIEIVENK
jgi:hypothetical protein